MPPRRVPLPSPAMAVAVCALFVALGGASYALTLPRNSVGPRQLRARAVTSTKRGTGTVTARARRDGAVNGRASRRGPAACAPERRCCAERLRAPASSAGEHGMSCVPTTSPRSPRPSIALGRQ